MKIIINMYVIYHNYLQTWLVKVVVTIIRIRNQWSTIIIVKIHRSQPTIAPSVIKLIEFKSEG